MDDYPNSGDVLDNDQQWTPEAPKERTEQEQKEQSKVTTSLPVIKEVIEWFEAQAKIFGSPTELDINEETPAEIAKQKVITAKHFSITYQNQVAQFKRDFAKYLKEETNE